MINFNKQAKVIYQQNIEAGWWDDPDRCIYQSLQLISTEIAEATEGERKNLMDDHLPDRKMGEVELADALIRLLDLGGRYDWSYIKPRSLYFPKDLSIAGKHMHLNMILSDLATSLNIIHRVNAKVGYNYSRLIGAIISVSDSECYDVVGAMIEKVEYNYSRLIGAIVNVSDSECYDVVGAMIEKLEYNKTRPDHKLSNRAKGGGKAF